MINGKQRAEERIKQLDKFILDRDTEISQLEQILVESRARRLQAIGQRQAWQEIAQEPESAPQEPTQ